MSRVARSTDGVDVHVRVRLPSDGRVDRTRTVLLAHANGFHGGVFAPLVERLCALGYACYALDFRGHGLNAGGEVGQLSWGRLADDCAAVVTALGLHGCHALGHSCGGHALLMAESRRPGTFASVYAFEPIFVVKPEDVPGLDVSPNSPLMASTEYMVRSASRRRAKFASAREALAAYSSKPPMNTWNAEALEAYVMNGGFIPDGEGVRLACTSETEVAVYQAGDRETEAFGELKNVLCPVVVAKGTSVAPDGKSPIYSAVIAAAIAAALPNGKLVEFPDNGHLGPMENPCAVADSAHELFSAVAATAPRSKL